MDVVLVVLLVVVVGAAAALVGVEVTRRRLAAASTAPDEPEVPLDLVVNSAVAEALGTALGQLREQNAADQAYVMQAALQQAAVMQREQLGAAATQARQATTAELDSKKDVIDARLEQVRVEVADGLGKLTAMVSTLATSSSEKFGQVDQSLRSHAEITQALSESARALREAMASPSARGQWGERMAEDVLRLAGFIENVNYRKQTQLDGATGRPDFTFPLPKGHELYMDVKFPMAAYLRYLEAGSEGERQAHRAEFLRDVRARVRELAKRDYATASAKQSVDYVLLFLPNEQLTGFIHEHDPALLDDAMNQRVVMCSPLTLFAFLGVIRQAYDNFVLEQTSDQILGLIGKFAGQWEKYNEQLGKLKVKFDQLDREFDQLTGTRKRQLDKPLLELERIRRERQLPIDGELFALDAGDEEGERLDETPPNVRRLGA
jgi:DNA recombination protein RmuC